jgi:hypothetical protein
MDAQVSVGISDGCGFCLVITEEYSPFITYPRPICDDFDLGAAVGAAYAFCLDSEIPVRVIDIPTDELPRLLRGVRHADVDGDGNPTSSDSLNILKFTIKIVESLPV